MDVEKIITEEENITWPPPPSLPAPAPNKVPPLLFRTSVWMVLLIDLGMALSLSAFFCLRRWMDHKPITLLDAALQGILPGSVVFVTHILIRRKFLAQKLQADAVG